MIRLNKWVILMGVSILPTVLGILMNQLIMKVELGGFMMFFLSFMFYLYWIYTGYKIRSTFVVDMKVFLVAHLIGVASLFLMAYQISVQGGFLTGYAGLLPQMYFLPGLSLIARFDVFGILSDLIKLSSVVLSVMVLCFYGGTRIAVKMHTR